MISQQPNRTHAVVAGAGIAGLLAARALAEHFAEVTILEKDPSSSERAPRPGVPQGRHLHILLPSGVEAIEGFFPGGIAELVSSGAKPFDYGMAHLYVYGMWLPRVKTELFALAQSRPLLEQHLARWVGRIPNVRLLNQVTVGAPIFDRSARRVTGVEFSMSGGEQKQKLEADLVVDATGRNTRLPQWLRDAGFGCVPESTVRIDLGYATGQFHVPEQLLPDSPLLYIVGPPPHQTKVGVLFQVEDGIVFGGMGGYHGDYPPAELDGFLRFAKDLSQPHVFNALSRAEPCACIEQFRIPASIRRRYDAMHNFPDGLLPIGDAICSLDPAFGQGMSIAALEAKILSRCLARNSGPGAEFKRDYFRGANAVLDAAWDLSSRENFRYPQTTGTRPWSLSFASRYMDFLVSARDPAVMAELYKVITLTAPPEIALRPRLAVRALKQFASPFHQPIT